MASIVDYLDAKGQPSSFTARSALAAHLGIDNYKGTAEQNTQLLSMLQGVKNPSITVDTSKNGGVLMGGASTTLKPFSSSIANSTPAYVAPGAGAPVDQAVQGAMSILPNVVVGTLQTTARDIGGFALDMTMDPNAIFKPTSAASKILFGEQDITPLMGTAQKDFIAGANTASTSGSGVAASTPSSLTPSQVAGYAPIVAGLVGLGTLTNDALNFTPFGGEKNAIRAVVAAKDAATATNFLKEAGVAAELWDHLAPAVIKASNEKEAKTVLDYANYLKNKSNEEFAAGADDFYKKTIADAQQSGKTINLDSDAYKVATNDLSPTDHAPYAQAVQRAYLDALEKSKSPDVFITIGGPGTGKSEVLGKFFQNDGGIMLQGTGVNLERLRQRLAEAVAAGKKPVLVSNLVEPGTAWEFAKARELAGGHTTEAAYFAKAYTDSVENLKKLIHEGQEAILIDSRSGTQRKIINPQEQLDELTRIRNSDIYEQLTRITKEARSASEQARDGRTVLGGSQGIRSGDQTVQRISEEKLDDLRLEISFLKDALADHPAAGLAKRYNLATHNTGKGLQDFNDAAAAKGSRSTYLDQELGELGYADFNEAQQGLEDYNSMRAQLKDLTQELKDLTILKTMQHKSTIQPRKVATRSDSVSSKEYRASTRPSPVIRPHSTYDTKLANPAEIAMKGTKLSTARKVVTSGRAILEKSGPSGKKMAQIMGDQRVSEDLLTGKYNVQILRALSGLTKSERLAVTDALEGGIKSSSPKVENAAKQIRTWLDDVATRAEADKFEMRTSGGGTVPFKRRENYYPRQYDFGSLAKGARRDEALQHLVTTGQARNLAEAEELLNHMIANAERRAGNLENPRILDLPGYEKDPSVALRRYAQTVAKRFTEAEAFGKKDEVIADLIKSITNEGGDYKEAKRIFDFTVDGSPKNKLVSAITQFNIVTKLSLSAIVNATQSINTMTKAGVLRTLQGMWKGFSKEGKELAELVNAYDDFVHVKEVGANPAKLVRSVMYVFKKVENFNRRTAANTGKLFYEKLTADLTKNPQGKYAIRQLESLGVDIGRALKGELTEDDLLTAANKMIEKTQFKIDPLDVPPSWKTPVGRLLVQFKSFSFMQTKFVRDEILKEARSGNFVPLVTFVTLAPLASYAVSMVRNKLTGREAGNVDIREWDQWMKAFGTIPTDLIIQGKFLNDTFQSDFKTPIEKGSRVAGTFLGPSADEFGKFIASLENIPRTEDKNKYLRKTGKEQDPYLLLERQAVEKIPFAGQKLKNTYFDFPKSTKTPEEKSKDQVMYDYIDELVKVPYGDETAKADLRKYIESLPTTAERERQLYIMSENGVDTKGVSSSDAGILYHKTQELLQQGKKAEAEALVSEDAISEEEYKAYQTYKRTHNTSTLRELLSTDPQKAVEFARTLDQGEQDRLILGPILKSGQRGKPVLTDEEYDLYELGKQSMKESSTSTTQ